MPHMMPSLWTLILMMTLISLLIIMILLYYMLNKTLIYASHKINVYKKNWIWKW
uniref:ATP synthase F0 subunit 8 n=1 Tax=Acropyga acutiventris TaxID=354291 RepID=A0A6G5NID9_9HYME|nr:ATP synthase F0 subunit 8 [Acropyga acutiventris]